MNLLWCMMVALLDWHILVESILRRVGKIKDWLPLIDFINRWNKVHYLLLLRKKGDMELESSSFKCISQQTIRGAFDNVAILMRNGLRLLILHSTYEFSFSRLVFELLNIGNSFGTITQKIFKCLKSKKWLLILLNHIMWILNTQSLEQIIKK